MKTLLTSWVLLVFTILMGNVICWKSTAVTFNRPKLNHTSFYGGPYRYPTIQQINKFKLVPEPMVITSRPLTFVSDVEGNKNNENDSKQSALITSNKVSFSYIPGVATVVCKGTSCSNSNHPFSNKGSNKKPDGFPGEAIPITDDQFFNVFLKESPAPSLLPTTPTLPVQLNSSPSSATRPSTTLVKLLTKRPYLQRGSSSKQKISVSSPKSIVRRSTTPSNTSPKSGLLGTRQRLQQTTRKTTTTTSKPAASASRVPTITYGRPNMLFPAAAAFTIMALPVAAAAVPLLLAAGRKRRSLPAVGRQLSLSGHYDDWTVDDTFSESIQSDLSDVLRSIAEVEKSYDHQDWNVQMQRLTKSKQRLQNAKDVWKRHKGQ